MSTPNLAKSLLGATALSFVAATFFAGCNVNINEQVEVSWTSGGAITPAYPNPVVRDCASKPKAGDSCQSYALGLERTDLSQVFSAQASSGYVFEGWTGCTLWDPNDASNSCVVAGGGQATKKIKAHFKLASYTGNFTKLDATGDPLPADATEWACVKDNNTGLTWEAKTGDGGAHDASWTYSWYITSLKSDLFEAAQPVGIQNGGTCAAGSRCDTTDFSRVTRLKRLCGLGGWRLPTLRELNSLVIPSQIGSVPVVDPLFFPDAAAGASYWSTQLRIDGGVNAMAVQRHDTGAFSYEPVEGGGAVARAVRLVR